MNQKSRSFLNRATSKTHGIGYEYEQGRLEVNWLVAFLCHRNWENRNLDYRNAGTVNITALQVISAIAMAGSICVVTFALCQIGG